MAIRFCQKKKTHSLHASIYIYIETMKCGSLLFSVTFINLSIMLTVNESGVNEKIHIFVTFFGNVSIVRVLMS